MLPMWWQITFTAIFFVWLFAVLLLLWRHALGGGEHIHRLHLILNETTLSSVRTAEEAAKAAQVTADAAQVAADAALRAVAALEKRYAE
jgi:hypothetical protein